MPELHMDVAIANRFISSLSKSLQALCHGCMDFDSGIEIVGYINVNIDSANKVDYVLHEKVLKSTTNSMTFVSNSFLARKEQPKQTRDGACSPVFDMNQQSAVASQYQSRVRSSFHELHPRNAASFTYGHRGSQKRAWAAMDRDWRMSSKKQRDGRHSHPSSETASSVHSHTLPSTSGQSPSDTNFKWPQTSAQGSDTNSDAGHPDINIKKEIFDNESEKAGGQAEQDHSQTPDQDANDAPEQATVSIKNDPDASTTAADDEAPASDGAVGEQDTEFKGTFLEPSASEDNQDMAEQNRSQTDLDDDNQQSTSSTSQLSGKSSHNLTEDNTAVTHDLQAENVAAGSEVSAEYDETGEEGAYPQSVYSDMGEGSSDAGQFEVIEIDDEDEDVQAMFAESRAESMLQLRAQHHFKTVYSETVTCSSSTSQTQDPHSLRLLSGSQILQGSVQCQYCPEILFSPTIYQRHLSICHPSVMPFCCKVCGKGMQTKGGLHLHMATHGERKFVCSVCDSKFKFKHHLKGHLSSVHKLIQCATCQLTFREPLDYRSHVLICGKT